MLGTLVLLSTVIVTGTVDASIITALITGTFALASALVGAFFVGRMQARRDLEADKRKFEHDQEITNLQLKAELEADKRKFQNDLASVYDQDLRNKRISVYRVLWKRLEPLAMYAPATAVTYKTLQTLMRSLRAWYYETGGLFLSERSRDAYFALQTEMQTRLKFLLAIDGCPEEALSDESLERELKDPGLKSVLDKGSDLRSALALDVGTRRDLRGKDS